MKHPELPRLPLKFLRWFCKAQVIDEIEGDLLEVYQQRYRTKPSTARRKFYQEVLLSFNKRNIGIMENYRDTSFGLSWAMAQQYGKILLRTIQRSKVYSAISIGSLTLGLTCAGLIFQYLNKELTYDQVYTQAESIYRINHISHNSGRTYAFAPIAMVPHLIETMDAVQNGTRIFKYRRAIPMTVAATNQSFNEPRFGWVDPAFFDLFDLKVLHGSKEDLNRPNVVMLNETTARKYFGDQDPLGQSVIFTWEEETALEVVGVFEDFPSNTSFQMDLLSNIETCTETMWSGGSFNEWQNMFVSAYILMRPDREQEVIQQAQVATSTYYTPEKPKDWEVSVQKLTDIHLAKPMDIGEWNAHNDSETLVLFAAIGILILCLGCFNFINMVTAQAGQRAKEMGVRKVLGSHRKQIAAQTLFETVCFVCISGVISWLLMYALLPRLGQLTNHQYFFSDIAAVPFLLGFALAIIIVALLAGAYPAAYISRINSLHLMRQSQAAVGGSGVRNMLVTAQFTMTAGLIICTIMVFLQMEYIRSKDLGFDDSMIVTMPIHSDDAVIPKINAFRNELKGIPGISNVTAASHEMLSDYTYISNFLVQGFDDHVRWERYTVDQDYIKTFELQLVAGRGFDSTIPTDSNAFVLNESAVRALNLAPEEVLNLSIADQSLEVTGKIIGVVKDFHFRSLHHNIQPFIMYVNWDRLDYISVRLASKNFAQNIDVLEQTWYGTFGDGIPFFYNFLDQQTAELYVSEEKERILFSSFSLLSVILGMLGLFGSALFTTKRRFKEIGLRKVLGASTRQLILMINSHFVKMIMIAFAIAAPIAFFLMNQWLAEFAYRIQQPLWVYLATILATFIVASVTVSFLSWKAAVTNPVDALKTE